MTRWQQLAETNPSATPEQQALMGLMVVAELENAAPPREGGPDAGTTPAPQSASARVNRRPGSSGSL